MSKKDVVKEAVAAIKPSNLLLVKLEKIKGDLQDCQFFIDSSDPPLSGEIYTELGISIAYLNMAIAELKKKEY